MAHPIRIGGYVTRWVLGTELRPDDQREALARFVHRFTGDHMPRWTSLPRPDGSRYPLQFKDDADWLAHTRFGVTNSGRLSKRVKRCESSPTWPEGDPNAKREA